MAGSMKGWSLMGILRIHGGLGRDPAGSDLDQARNIAARRKGNPVGIDPGGIAILVPGQDGRPFDHGHPDVVGEANLYADTGQVGEGGAQVFLDLGWDGVEDGLSGQVRAWR